VARSILWDFVIPWTISAAIIAALLFAIYHFGLIVWPLAFGVFLILAVARQRGTRTADSTPSEATPMRKLKRIQFAIDIAAPAHRVFRIMLDPEHYKTWTTPFAEGSHYRGTWVKGEKIHFLAPSGDGMISEIAEHQPSVFTSIRHLGMISNGVEDTHSDAVRAWAPAYENYTFNATPGGTQVVVDQDVTAEFEQYVTNAWPLALQRLKALCEQQHATT
jgi:hypothetical protein